MKTILNYVFVLLVVSSTCYSQRDGQDGKLSQETKASLDDVVDRYVSEELLSGVVAKIYREGEMVYHKETGFANIATERAISSDNLFRLASLTKPIVSVALMQLVESGDVKLDDPVSTYIPSFEDVRVYRDSVTTDPINSKPTVRDALMHLIGIGSGFEQSPADRNLVSYDFQASSLEELAIEFARIPLAHQPGTSFSYGYSTDIVGRIIEVASGQSIGAYLRQNLFVPLGMKDTFYEIPNDKVNRLGPVYSKREGKLTEVVPAGKNPGKFERGATGLVSTIDDYMNFCQMLLNEGQYNGKRLLRKETVRQMTTNQLSDDLMPLTVAGIQMTTNGFGLGFAIAMGRQSEWKPIEEYTLGTLSNLPAGCFYWLGAYNDTFWIDPIDKTIGIIMTQSSDVGRIAIHQEFFQAYYGGELKN